MKLWKSLRRAGTRSCWAIRPCLLYTSKNITISPEGKESVVNLRMQKILRYIEEHYAEDITLADLSKSANISKSESVSYTHLCLLVKRLP